jgi:hypothetical protein
VIPSKDFSIYLILKALLPKQRLRFFTYGSICYQWGLGT